MNDLGICPECKEDSVRCVQDIQDKYWAFCELCGYAAEMLQPHPTWEHALEIDSIDSARESEKYLDS